MSPFLKRVVFVATVASTYCSLAAKHCGTVSAQERELSQPVYDADRQHPWNRVHAALFIRKGLDGLAYGADRLEPLLWTESDHLIAGDSAEHAAAVLEEFLRDKGELLFEDPLKRAILQRDLWLVANWLTRRPDNEARKRLETVLAHVIRRLALTPEKIAKLPDNYAAAVASKRFADRFEPDRPDLSYLPPDLFQKDGPWVCVGRNDEPTARLHLREGGTNPFTNSAFFIFLKLPGGRSTTLDFLKRLAEFDEPYLLPNTDEKTNRSLRYLPNAALPQWPKGTEVALVRRALLIDSTRSVVASPLTESVQLRVIRTETPAPTPETFGDTAIRRNTNHQAFTEFQFRRRDLFAKETRIGLRDVSAERDFKTGFSSHQWDAFDSLINSNQPFPQRAQPFDNNRASCIICHQLPGVYSFNSLPGFEFGQPQPSTKRDSQGAETKPRPLVVLTVEQVEQFACHWKAGQQGWKALRTLLPE